MDALNNSLTLTAGQVAEVRQKLMKMRHDVNNCLSLVVATVELARVKGMTPRLLSRLSEQPPKIREELHKFAGELNAALTPPPKS